MTLSSHKHILWDWNGTLFDDAYLCMEVMNLCLKKRKLPLLTLDRYQESFGFPVIDYYRRLGFDFDRESFEIVGTEFILEYEKRKFECSLQPTAKEILHRIHDAGITQSVLSAYKQNSLEEVIRHFGLERYFIRLVGLQDHYAGGKIDHGKRWIQDAGYRPADVLLIGDTVHDYEVAQAMGIDCILVRGGHNSLPRLKACGVLVLNSLAELAREL